MTKNENISFANIGQTVYTTSISNIGNTDATNIVFRCIPSGLTFVPNTLTVDSVLQPNANPNTGVLLATLPPNEIYSIVSSYGEQHSPSNPAQNTASTTMNLLLIQEIRQYRIQLALTLHFFK